MKASKLISRVQEICKSNKIDIADTDADFYSRFLFHIENIYWLFTEIYSAHHNGEKEFDHLLQQIITAHIERSDAIKATDLKKLQVDNWFLSNQITGMSLYVDRFCTDLKTLNKRLDYFTETGINLLHLMPLFQSPAGESDGGYAVSDFRKIDSRFGTLEDLKSVRDNMRDKEMYLMIDIVLNHTSHHHEWAEKAKAGDAFYQSFFYLYPDRQMPDEFDRTMSDIFPESAPGNFTHNEESGKWVMTVFHNYQWDLNYTNPAVFNAMLDNIFFYGNLGVDILRIDAPAFIWKQVGTTSQNLPQAHKLLQLIRQCVDVACPGMALLGEAIVAPKQIMEYFGTGMFAAKECDFAYNATQMALQWDALATGDTRVMMAAQAVLLQKPFGTSWITYTRCHDDIGLGYDDYMIEAAGFSPYEHRGFLNRYYTGNEIDSKATGALFSHNPKTGDARISGTLASLCGLEKALEQKDDTAIDTSIDKILMMQAQSLFIGGLPMLFYGDETGYTNDYSYLNEPDKNYDNRWMHRPKIDWSKNELRKITGTIEERIFSATKKLIAIRNKLPALADQKNLTWLSMHNSHIAGFKREIKEQRLYCLFNFDKQEAFLTWYTFKEHDYTPLTLYDHWSGATYKPGADHDYLIISGYSFMILEG
ncbi:MAG: amylosucrase [Ginsengibacter sp.]